MTKINYKQGEKSWINEAILEAMYSMIEEFERIQNEEIFNEKTIQDEWKTIKQIMRKRKEIKYKSVQ